MNAKGAATSSVMSSRLEEGSGFALPAGSDTMGLGMRSEPPVDKQLPDVVIPRSWKPELERKLSELFGQMYTGYLMEQEATRIVGFASVKPEYRGRGYFKSLLGERLKEGADIVVLLHPTEPTRELAEGFGYVYDPNREVSIWHRGMRI